MKDWQAFLNPDIQAFIAAHEDSDIRNLALATQPHTDRSVCNMIFDQIKTRQKAKSKAPQLLEIEGFIFPSADIFEQASSTATARYKASLFEGKSFADLTGGAGIDSWAFAQKAKTGIVIDADETNAAILKHNYGMETHCETAENFVKTMPNVDIVLIDPQRRNETKKGLYRFEDCSPNVLELLPHIKSKIILIKASPMMDIHEGIAQLHNISDIHIVEYQGECKELLFIVNANEAKPEPDIHAVKIDDNGNIVHTLTFTYNSEQNTGTAISQPLKYLYEPGPAFLKSGGYKTISGHYKTPKLHPHTHLYTSETMVEDFPGRSFKIIDLYPVQARALPFAKANLTLRNFPGNIETLRKKLKLKDGGEEYCFATTLHDGNHKLIHCKKIKSKTLKN